MQESVVPVVESTEIQEKYVTEAPTTDKEIFRH